ncbi:MAG: MATE family efflux transporter [Tissierellia bacterium]|nr:MATE family efflux transporter [Tissierellia bacterium]
MNTKIKSQESIIDGNLSKVLISLSLPIMLNNFIQTLYNLADAMWVGRIGEVEFAATSFVWPVIFLFMSIGLGFSIAGTSLLSQSIGANEEKLANQYANHLMLMSTLLSIFFAFLGYFLTDFIIKFMGADGQLFIHSTEYLRVSFLGFPFIFSYYVINAILVSQGNTVISTVISGVSALINIVLDPIFIFDVVPGIGIKGFGMGIRGAAIATVISQAAMLVLGLFMLHKKSKKIRLNYKNFKFEGHISKNIIRIAIPSSVGMGGTAFGFVILNSFIGSYGTPTLAAFGMINRITDIISQTTAGIGSALTVIIGQNIGAGQLDRAKEAFKKAIVFVLQVTILSSIVLFIFRNPVVNAFINTESDSQVIDLAQEYLNHNFIIIPSLVIFNAFQGLYQGAGRTEYSMFMEIFRLWMVRIPFILLFKYFTDLGSSGIWIAMTLSNVSVAVLGYIIYKSERWIYSYK